MCEIHIKLLFITFTIRTHGGCCHVIFLHACTNTPTRKQNRSKTSYFAMSTQTFHTYLSICAHTHSLARTHSSMNVHTQTHRSICTRMYTCTLCTHTHTHTLTLIKIRLALVIYRNPLKSLGDFLSFSWFVHFLRSVMFTIYSAWDFGYRLQCIQISYVYIHLNSATMLSFLSIWLANHLIFY